MVVRILDHVDTASTYEDGDKIYRLIAPELDAGNEVAVSFDGIHAVPSAFVNGAFVRLLETLPFSTVRSKLKILDSTRQINELVRSRFEFVSDPNASVAPIREGIYSVEFVASGRKAGQGIVVLKGSTVNGGDVGFVYTGRVFGTPEALTADLKIKRWNAGYQSVLGNLTEFRLALSGKGNTNLNTFSIVGAIPGEPGRKLSIVGRLLTPAT
jgi:hypothetical protein